MTRESVEDKARRLLVEGRVVVDAVQPGLVVAVVRGSGELYVVSWRRGGWLCTCPVRGRCSHLLAVQTVTAPVRPDGTPWNAPPALEQVCA